MQLRKNATSYLLSFGVVLLCLGGLLTAPQIAAQGIRAGLALCAGTMIPALFPFLVLSGFLTESGLYRAAGRLFSPLATYLFRLPDCAGAVFAMSLIGGFPVGLRMTAQLQEQGALTQRQAARMSLFCINAGPAFLIAAVGGGMLGSRRAGALLFASVSLSALLIGIGCALFAPHETPLHKVPVQKHGSGDALVNAVSQATSALWGICAWILLFSALMEYLRSAPLPEGIVLSLRMLAEVSDGSLAAAGLPLPFLAATVAFCGLCVHCQVLPELRRCGQSYSRFLLSRSAAAGLSALLCHGLLRLFPIEHSVLSNGVQAQPAAFSLSAPAAAALLFLGALLILDLGVDSKNYINKN